MLRSDEHDDLAEDDCVKEQGIRRVKKKRIPLTFTKW
jgi:hypothetical protein